MPQKKSLATAESNSADNTSANTDAEPRPVRSSTAPSAGFSRLRRRSQSSLRFGSHAHARASISCVSRETTPGEDCARQRFILWAAMERNRSIHMAASERSQCPLLRCDEQFEGHEEMLRHLTQCRHLSTGEYFCYECMRVERFDYKCNCLLGQPTKRNCVIDMANHFSNIGSENVRRENPSQSIHNTQPCPLQRYGSLLLDTPKGYSQECVEQQIPREQSDILHHQLKPGRVQPTLNSTKLLESNSTPLLPTAELATINHDAHPTTMLSRRSPYDKEEPPLPPTTNLTSKPRLPLSFPTGRQLEAGSPDRNGARRPSLTLNTRVDRYSTKPHAKSMSPNSSPPPGSHGISPVTPRSPSAKSQVTWSPVLSQDATLASPITPLSADARPIIPLEDHIFNAEKDTEIPLCPEDPFHYKPKSIPDLCGEKQPPAALSPFLPRSLMFAYGPKANYAWIPSMDTKIPLDASVNMMFTDPGTKTDIPPGFLGSPAPGLERKALVEQVWDTLSEHFSTSVSKLNRLQNNSLAGSLRVQTLGAVASAGLTRLRKFINHDYHTRPDPFEYLCFIHLIHSISLVIHEDGLTTRSNKLYGQAMAYSERFGTAYRDDYRQIVTVIWQPNSQEPTSRGQITDPANRPIGNKGKELDDQISRAGTMNPDPLVITGQNFLDELENIVVKSNIHQPIEVLNSDLWASHLPSNQSNLPGDIPFTAASAYLVQDLCRNYPDYDRLLGQLQAIGHNARGGYYPSIRKLELELIRTGKEYFASHDLRDQYNLEVRGLCDQFYARSGTRRRAEYHLLGVSLVESLFRSISRSPQQLQEGHPEYPLIPYQYEDEFLPTWSYPLLPMTQQPGNVEGITDFGPSLDLTTLHPVASNTQQAVGSPNHLSIKADASETASESYAASPAPLSDAPPPEITGSHSYRPTPPFQDRGEGSETRPSTLVSSGQKVEASERCEICGYRPKGDPQWFKGSMAKHKKMQHSTNPPNMFKCPFPGCNSEYKNRKDNLRQHQIEKNHFVGDEARPPLKRKRNQHT
ncbi:hypothetical protein F4861DRAFT_195836 [Xylaria intraflava]|nr:hypothetical protein F4861DRAFT_195836 [Xylaria intraflava]